MHSFYLFIHLTKTIKLEFNTFGNCYKKGFSYNSFLAMTNPRDAAIAFAAVYERCGTGSYNLRAEAAIKAYEYFDLNK